MSTISNDIARFRTLLKGVDVIDIVSFGSAISPEYLINLLAEASWNGSSNKKFGFIGTSLPGDGWSGGFNTLLNSRCVDWVIGGFFGAARSISIGLENGVEVHNLPQGIISKLMISESRNLTSHIGVDTFIDPSIRGALINNKPRCDISSVTRMNENKLDYSLPDNQLVLVRGEGFSVDGAIVLEEKPLNLDTDKIIKSALAKKTKIAIQIPNKVIDRSDITTVDRSLFDEVFISPPALHKTSYMNSRYLTLENPYITRNCSTTIKLSNMLQKRIKEKESIIVGIGLPVSAINRCNRVNNLDIEINIESGNRGGILVDGEGFGLSLGGEKPISQLDMFERIWNKDIDHALLGVGEIDKANNINVANLGDKFFGVGGFLDITQSIDKITFCTRKKEKLASINEFNCFKKDNNKNHVILEA